MYGVLKTIKTFLVLYNYVQIGLGSNSRFCLVCIDSCENNIEILVWK